MWAGKEKAAHNSAEVATKYSVFAATAQMDLQATAPLQGTDPDYGYLEAQGAMRQGIGM